MRKVILLLSIFAFGACSSTPEETATDEPAVTTEAPATAATETTPTTTVAADMGGGGATATPPAEPMVDSSGEFPPIEGTERTSTTCTSGSDTRILAIIDRKSGGCGNVYTKFGTKKTIALAAHDMSYCDKVHDNVKSNLESGGMDCGSGAATATPAPAPKKPEAKPAPKAEAEKTETKAE